MENFIEYSLPYKMTAKDRMMQMLCAVGPMLLGVALIMFLGVLGILLCAGLCFVSYRMYLSYIYELEYTLLEEEISFSKIINKERRRELLTASIAKTESYGPIDRCPATSCPIKSLVSHQGDLPEYFWITYDQKGNKVCILFQPTPAVLDVFAIRARGKLR